MTKTKTLYTSNNHVDISGIMDLNNGIQTGGSGSISKSNNAKLSKMSGISKTRKTLGKNNKSKKNKNSDDELSDNSIGGDSDDESSNPNDSDDSDDFDDEPKKSNTQNKNRIEDDDNIDDDMNSVEERDESDNEKNNGSDNEGSNIDDREEKDYIVDDETLKSKCYSKYAKVDYEDLDFDELFGEETLVINTNSKLTKPILTKYEFVRLLTDRSKQLAQGAKPMIKNISGLSSKEIAKLELKNKIIPLIIERPIPNSVPERWKLTELEIPEHFFTN